MAKTKTILQRVGHELKVNPPSILAKTRKRFGAGKAEVQRKAILLSKARRVGANVPERKGQLSAIKRRLKK